MNNSAVQKMLDDCTFELSQLEALVVDVGPTSSIVPYLTKYAIVRSCGTIEQSFKTIVADHCCKKSTAQVKEFLRVRVRESSSNPSWDNICTLLKQFDLTWSTGFKGKVAADVDSAQLKESLKSLVGARNDFAHGGNPSTTIGDVKDYFSHASRIIMYLDTVVA